MNENLSELGEGEWCFTARLLCFPIHTTELNETYFVFNSNENTNITLHKVIIIQIDTIITVFSICTGK